MNESTGRVNRIFLRNGAHKRKQKLRTAFVVYNAMLVHIKIRIAFIESKHNIGAFYKTDTDPLNIFSETEVLDFG